ncbi:DUF5047 domain-containing protein [Amycolatopsis sp. FU40]|uniref:DUF5047 domain-containing protein n=1 Tax=Amycolatopsis sp. FU40 TaxID=2914159 RepID=UPI001F29E5C6|nr:DUF5047 domain-containing protein [Amycolatopsis sp. FU40]UKD55162.1 DUF5047 domain-containing protein [Amycolatopsis sp. FU40]
MWDLSDRARDILGTSHTVDVKAVVQSPYFGTRTVPVLDGEVNVDSGSQVRRTATLVTDPGLWPVSPRELLTPFGSTCALWRGIVIPEQPEPEWIPLGVFYLNKTKRARSSDSRSAATIDLVDPSQWVADDRFAAPTQTAAGATYIAGIKQLIWGTLGQDYPVIDYTGNTDIAPVMDIEKERWGDGIEKLADAIGAEVFFDQIGQVIVRPLPTLGDAPVWYARTGSGGNVLTTDEEWDRDNVWNRWVINGERSDGSLPVREIVSDDDENSPTYVGGPFGARTRFYSSPAITSTGQAIAAGRAFLARTTGLACKVDFSIVVNPALTAGDVIELDDAELGRANHIIDKLTIPLTASGALTCSTRSDLLLPAES